MSDAVCWRWLEAKWPYAVPAGSVVVTNLRALKGEHVSEAARWEHDQWEMFSGSSDDVTDEQIRVVPLATLVGADSTLVPALALEVGKGIRRSTPRGMWKPWRQ